MFTPELHLEHTDARGEIYSITLPGDQELMLLHSKAGSLRGGHSHDVDEIVVVLTGKMGYHKVLDGKEVMDVVKAGEGSFNKAGVVHMGQFEEDSWLVEWRVNTRKGKSKNSDYPAWRERVVANSAG